MGEIVQEEKRNTILVKKNCVVYNDKTYTIEQMYSKAGYEYADSLADSYYTNNIYENVAYMYYILDVIMVQHFLIKYKIQNVVFYSPEKRIKDIVYDACEGQNICIHGGGNVKFHDTKCKAIILIEKLYLVMKAYVIKKKSREIDYSKDLCILRTKAAKSKIKNKTGRFIIEEEKPGVGSLYELFTTKERIQAIKRAHKKTLLLVENLKEDIIKWKIFSRGNDCLLFVGRRLLPSMYYGELLDMVLNGPWKGCFISANNLDLYACIEEKITKEKNIKTICIPHGLEYGYRFPHCFTGDVFYATSQSTADFLNRKYNTTKFVFDEAVANEMFLFNVGDSKIDTSKKVVYFPEPREPEVNIQILDDMVKELKKYGIQIYIKHHPGDIIGDYKKFEGIVEEINDLKSAVIGNICISRKSTVLLEAIYNGSKSAAITINEKDTTIFDSFPSLQDQRIKRFNNTKELCIWIRDQYLYNEGAQL